MTHKPIEKAEKTDGKNKMISDSNSSNKQEASLESKSEDDHGMAVSPRRDEKLEEIQLTLDETNDLLNNYQMLCGSFDLDSWLNQDTNPSSSYTSSFSMEESNNPSMGETTSIQEDSLKPWVDSVDSFLSLDSFIHLEENSFLRGK